MAAGVGVMFVSALERGKASAEVGKVLAVLNAVGLDVYLTTRARPTMAGAATRALIVYLRAEACGRLERAEELGYRFTYDGAWLEAYPNELLSMSLPRQEALFEAAATKPFFRGLLPEGRRRERLEGRYRLREGDDFGLLAEIGGDCPGAVAVLMPDEDPAALDPAAEPEPIAIDPAELIRNLRGDVATNLGQRRGKRLSVAGRSAAEGRCVGSRPARTRPRRRSSCRRGVPRARTS